MSDPAHQRAVSGLRLRSRLLLILVLLGWVPLALFGGFSYQQAKSALEQKELDQLIVIRDLKVREIEAYFQQMEGQMRTLSRSPLVVDALQQLPLRFSQLSEHFEHGRSGQQGPMHPAAEGFEHEIDFRLRHFYRDQVLKPLQQLDPPPTLTELYPTTHTSHRAQSLYLQHNPFAAGEREWLDDAGDGSAYSALHRQIHPILRGYRQEFGYYDLFLVDLEGNVLYSVAKEIDFATRLVDGPYRDSTLGRVWREAMAEEDGDAVVVAGLERYLPSQFHAAGFLGSPVFDRQGERRLGVLLAQFPLDRINTIVQDRQGMEVSSEVVLGMQVGASFTFQLQPDPQLQHVTLPRNPLIQMVLNLLKNGMESIRMRQQQQQGAQGAAAPGGVIQVRLRRLPDGNHFEIAVEDDGVGIAPEVLKSLFTFGFTTKPTGSGFGLHASANFVRSLEGRIRAENVAEGSGAIFLVELPLRVEKKD